MKMTVSRNLSIGSCLAVLVLSGGRANAATPFVQCPGDQDQDAIPESVDPAHPNAKCMHLAAGDGFASMADGRVLYNFGFSDLTGVPPEAAVAHGMLAASSPAPTITLDAGQEFFLSVTNVGMVMRPDLFDAHSVHFHGFPNAAPIFDGMPESSVAVNMGATLTYYYRVIHPGTYMYHCHVEATEHMQMGMIGNLYVRPAQNRLPEGTDLSGFVHRVGQQYVYDDGDGSTRYDVEYPIQVGSFDPAFHDASQNVQPLPFAEMRDRYPTLNGRGYPDTIRPDPLPAPVEAELASDRSTQGVSSLIRARVGQRVLLRISNLNVTNFYTLGVIGLSMRVVGHGARELRGSAGQRLHYDTASVTLGGGEAVDVIIDTAQVPAGTYFLYTTNLNYLSNDAEDYGGMMTEIVVAEAGVE
jgi:FtsP/CotA-like multicopper oxidase with cupredoxin domain